MSRALRLRAEMAREAAAEIKVDAKLSRINSVDAVSRLAQIVEGLANAVAELSVESDQRAGMAVEVEMGRAEQW